MKILSSFFLGLGLMFVYTRLEITKMQQLKRSISSTNNDTSLNEMKDAQKNYEKMINTSLLDNEKLRLALGTNQDILVKNSNKEFSDLNQKYDYILEELKKINQKLDRKPKLYKQVKKTPNTLKSKENYKECVQFYKQKQDKMCNPPKIKKQLNKVSMKQYNVDKTVEVYKVFTYESFCKKNDAELLYLCKEEKQKK